MGNVYIFDSLLLYFHGLMSIGFCTKIVALRLTDSVWKKKLSRFSFMYIPI